MASLKAHLTELEAVNEMLLSVSEAPVNSLDSGLGDAAAALDKLRKESRRIQMRGYMVNTLESYTLSKNNANQFVVPDNTLKVDTVRESAIYDVAMRRSSDNTKWVLFDREKNSETWTTPSTLKVDIVQFLEFDHLTPALQYYVLAVAAHEFQKGAMASQVLNAFTDETVAQARADAEAEEAENEDSNVLTDSPTSFSIAYRNNPLWGK